MCVALIELFHNLLNDESNTKAKTRVRLGSETHFVMTTAVAHAYISHADVVS